MRGSMMTLVLVGVWGVGCSEGPECASNFDCYAGQQCSADGACIAGDPGTRLPALTARPDDPMNVSDTGELLAASDVRFRGNIGATLVDGAMVFTGTRYAGVTTLQWTSPANPSVFFLIATTDDLFAGPGVTEITYDANVGVGASYSQACNYSDGATYDEVLPEVVVTVDETEEDGVFDVDVSVDGEGTDGIADFRLDTSLL
jgi:hypothetical protein